MSAQLPAICTEMHVRLDGNVPVVNSRDVGDEFEKRHDNVLRDIELLLGSSNLRDQADASVILWRSGTAMTKPPEDPNWPDWLAATWGPAPKGPRLRAEALARDAAKREAINRRLDGKPFQPLGEQPPQPKREMVYTADELRRARIALGIEPPPMAAE